MIYTKHANKGFSVVFGNNNRVWHVVGIGDTKNVYFFDKTEGMEQTTTGAPFFVKLAECLVSGNNDPHLLFYFEGNRFVTFEHVRRHGTDEYSARYDAENHVVVVEKRLLPAVREYVDDEWNALRLEAFEKNALCCLLFETIQATTGFPEGSPIARALLLGFAL